MNAPRRRVSSLLLAISMGGVLLFLLLAGSWWISARATRELHGWLVAAAPPGTHIDRLRVRVPAHVSIARVSVPLHDSPVAERIVVDDLTGTVDVRSLLSGKPSVALRASYAEGTVAVSCRSLQDQRRPGALALALTVNDVKAGIITSALGQEGWEGSVSLEAEGIVWPSNPQGSDVRSHITSSTLSIPEMATGTVILPQNRGASVDTVLHFFGGELRIESAHVGGPAYEIAATGMILPREPLAASAVTASVEMLLKKMPRLVGDNPDELALTQAFLSLLLASKSPVFLNVSGTAAKPDMEIDTAKTMSAMAGK